MASIELNVLDSKLRSWIKKLFQKGYFKLKKINGNEIDIEATVLTKEGSTPMMYVLITDDRVNLKFLSESQILIFLGLKNQSVWSLETNFRNSAKLFAQQIRIYCLIRKSSLS